MTLVLHNAAVFHVASAIGNIQEHMVRIAAGQMDDKQIALSFGLRQCNKSINLLTRAAREGQEAYNDPGIALIVCILFSFFEAWIGDPREALIHLQQGRRILWKCEQNPPGAGGSRLVNTTTARSVVNTMAIQSASLSGGHPIDDASSLDPLYLPDLDTIYTLDEANDTLYLVYSNILIFHQSLRAYCPSPTDDLSAAATQKHLRFSPWLKLWEQAFATFLFRESASLSHEDMQKAKVLKANHLLCTVLARVDTTAGFWAWEPFTPEFKAIVDLAAAVLNAEHRSTASECAGRRAGIEHVPCMSSGLWIADPLYVCLSRCTEPEFRRQAAGLLGGMGRVRCGKGPVKKGKKVVVGRRRTVLEAKGSSGSSSSN